MKIKNILVSLSAILAVCVMTGCDDEKVVEPQFFENVILADDYVEVNPNVSTSIAIKSGSGGYKVSSLNEEVATATLSGKNIDIVGHKAGKAGIVIIDKEGVEALVNVLVFDELTISANTISINTNGTDGDAGYFGKIKINTGNGGYKVESLDAAVDLSVDEEDFIVVKTSAEMTDVVAKVSDRTGRSVNFTITAVDPYKDFKAKTELGTEFKGTTRKPGEVGFTYYEEYLPAPSDYYHYGWRKTNYDCLEIQITGDLKPGLKAKNSVRYGFSYSDYINLTTLPTVRVVKNNGSKVWITFIHTKNAVDYTAYMVQNVVAIPQ